MKRRRALGAIALGGIAGFFGFAGYKYHKLSNPDINNLKDMKALISSISEVIIPSTGTPGAKEAKVSDFILKMAENGLKKATLSNFIQGLEDVESLARENYGVAFTECKETAKISILSAFEKRDRPMKGIMGKIYSKLLGDPFFVTMKNLTVEGYVTSEIGATQSLSYLPVPGKYQGCVTLKPNQKAWAT